VCDTVDSFRLPAVSLLFTYSLFTVKVHYMFRPNWPSSGYQVLTMCLTRRLLKLRVPFRLVLHCRNACVQFCGFVTCFGVPVPVLHVFIFCIRCILLGSRPSCLYTTNVSEEHLSVASTHEENRITS
jgi:hypothetical protein